MRRILQICGSLSALALAATAANAESTNPTVAPATVMPLNFSLQSGTNSTGGVTSTDAAQASQAEPKKSDDWSGYLNAGPESAALFADQALTAVDHPTMVVFGGVTYKKTGTTFEIWTRQPFPGDNPCNAELDAAVLQDVEAGPVTFTGKVAMIRICGPNAYQFRLKAKGDLGNGFSLSGKVELITGGFKDKLVQAELGYSHGFGRTKKLKLELTAAAAYDDYAGGMTAAWSATLSHPVNKTWSVSGFAKGYFGPNGNDKAFGFNFGRGF